MMEYKGFSTRAIHSLHNQNNMYRALTQPVFATTTYKFDSCSQGGRCFSGEEEGFVYSRLSNPTNVALEERMAILEGAEAAVAVGSGMGAIFSTISSICSEGDHIVSDKTLYGGTYSILTQAMDRFGVETSLIDINNTANLKKVIKKNTKIVYFETPINPIMKVTDIFNVAQAVHKINPNIKVVVDNTFATPYLQNPLNLGADIVIHSATKYINGHGDVIAGIVAGSKKDIKNIREIGLNAIAGCVLGAWDAYLIIRGLKTLSIRMEKHCENAMKVAKFLEQKAEVDKVYYPGLETHESHEIAAKQMRLYGGLVSFELKGGKKEAMKLLDNLKLCSIAVSLGDAETLVEHPASMSHSQYSHSELKDADIPEGLIRMSVGLEEIEDILADLEQSFNLL